LTTSITSTYSPTGPGLRSSSQGISIVTPLIPARS
jgi:hypothetical protein